MLPDNEDEDENEGLRANEEDDQELPSQHSLVVAPGCPSARTSAS